MEKKKNRDEYIWRNDGDKELYDKVAGFGYLFDDMLFKPGSITYWAVESPVSNETESGTSFPIPTRLSNFEYDTNCKYRLEDVGNINVTMKGVWASFKKPEPLYGEILPSIYVSPEHFEDVVVLHEMIHLHESLINQSGTIYHEICLWSLYHKLEDKVPNLEKLIHIFGNLFAVDYFKEEGGLHDLLFFLKTLDIDYETGREYGETVGGAFQDYLQTELEK